ncbi:MAG TPA: molybdate ABC transporter substrate-binding protein [Candidatus Acidoferrales bacterium]
MRFPLLAACLLVLNACGTVQPPQEVHVAAAANLGKTLNALDAAFEAKTHVHVVPSLGATVQLATQIENGGPFDVFLSADVDHVDSLVKSNALDPQSRAIYARGRLVVWTASRTSPKDLQELTGARAIAIAKPELAPYGAAAVESLQNLGLWDRLQPRVVYASSVSTAKEYADTGNAEAAFTALSLVFGEPGHYFPVDDSQHKPIDQALGIVRRAPQPALGRQFADFVLSPEGKAILTQAGYGTP